LQHVVGDRFNKLATEAQKKQWMIPIAEGK